MKRLLGLLLVLAFATAVSFGQAVSVNGGSIQGSITDASGAVVPQAKVVILSADTGFTKSLTTDSAGYYSIGPLNPGPYTVTVTAPGFSTLEVKTAIKTGTVTTGNFKLTLGAASDTVEVNAGAVQINTDQIGVSGVVTREQIDSLPINGRNILDVAQVQPGVILQSGQSFDPTKAGYSAISVGGVSGRTTRILLDGQDITDETVGTTIFNVSSGAVDEFQLNRSTQDVSGEVTSTGQVLVATRSGTNSFHGQAFYLFQDARTGFAATTGGANLPFQRNQFGGNIGGPIIKDKLFFFADVERIKQDQQGRAQASDSTFEAITTAYPYIPAPFRDLYTTGRLDYNAPKGIHLFARAVYSLNRDDANFGNLYSIYANRDNVPALVGGADFTTGRFTHSIRGGYEKFHNLLTDGTGAAGSSIYNPLPLGGPNGSATLYDPTDGFYAGANQLAPQQTYQSDKQLRYDGTWTKGAHNFKFGGEMNRIQGGGFAAFYSLAPLVIFGPQSQFLGPTATDPTAPGCQGIAGAAPCPGDPLNGYSAETYLAGNGSGLFSERPGFGLSGGDNPSWRFAAYAADTWKALPSLSITAGLRWSVDTDRANQDLPTPLCSQVDPSLQFSGCTGNTPLFDQYQVGLGTKTKQPYANFGPQFGFVYSPVGNKYSLRGGAGIYYDSDIFNNTGNARPSSITASGHYFNYGVPCSNYFPGTSLNASAGVNGVPLSTLCGESIAQAITGLDSLQSQYETLSAASAGPNPNFIGTGGDLVANNIYGGPYKTPYSIQLSGGGQYEVSKGLIVSADFVHNATLKIPMTIDVNHVGAARYFNLANAQAAVAATLSACGAASVAQAIAPGGCPSAGNGSSATIADFSNNGLDSGNNGVNFSGTPNVQSGAAFGGINPNVGIGKFILPIGRSGYDALQMVLQQQKAHPLPYIVSSNLQISYTLSRIVTSAGGGTSDQLFAGTSAWDYDNPTLNIGRNDLDHTNELSFAGAVGIKYGLKLAFTGHFFSAPPTTLTLDNEQYGGQGEIFRTDINGDGTTGDLVPGTLPGYYMHQVKGSGLATLISNYNTTHAGQLTPAGQQLVNSGLFTAGQLVTIGAAQQPIATVPATPLNNPMFRAFDFSASYPISLEKYARGVSIEPGCSIYNAFNMSNFGTLGGVLVNQADNGGAIGTTPGFLNGPNDQSQLRTQRGAGTYDAGAPRSTEFSLKVNF
jgi:hypothetical protein